MEDAIATDLAIALAIFAVGTGFGELFRETKWTLLQRIGRSLKIATLICTGFLSWQIATGATGSILPFLDGRDLGDVLIWFAIEYALVLVADFTLLRPPD